jgi:hypothetical protein
MRRQVAGSSSVSIVPDSSLVRREEGTMNANDVEAIGERFTRLEREVRLWRRAATATTVLLVALIAFSPTRKTQEARAADSFAKDLVVRSLAIVDERGIPRIVLDSNKNTPRLRFSDEKGTTRAALGVDKVGPAIGPALLLYDENGTVRAGLDATKDRTALMLFDEKGTTRTSLGEYKAGPVLDLRDEKGTTRAALAATEDGSVLGLQDEKGTPRAILGADKDGPGLNLSDKDGKPIWRAP